ncbi:MarR family transcriptional regulator [Cupriavidus plantarum]|uniref:DNA-binding MarR family transcriptional regulator n=1 Tax=Cupriavidus plantarum TaxID=942865 RepID=A0A316F056_9BURK|nr:MarR family transcriptional regulator [Cupriavidus plantarum]NYH98679.1 hypothetical protein [Cupriavidus plantarum]PWK37692.1 hypothetical protein C7419_1011575 [Cupriavidus plantarum]REF01602.1 hypothetical protein C7418_0385 [Cupriavidus plantarum]RLK45539.1 hypothetical protein C7417_1557 [Cupriavidus plantarum]CAG2128108.1 hypothetical protein LMG26296_01157 [Cupriavidus plantarum]
MQPKALETNEPVVLALVDAVTAWQAALEQTLSVSGLTYTKWLLLRAIGQERLTRAQPFHGPVFMDIAEMETQLASLHADGWIEFTETGNACISPAARARFDRAAQAVKALHSVSVGHLNSEERAALGGLLQRMTGTLHDHAERRSRLAA